MLVISQKEKDEILIGKDITVRILELKPGRVKLGIEAPENVKIRRVQRVSDNDNEQDIYAEKQHKHPDRAGKPAEERELSEK